MASSSWWPRLVIKTCLLFLWVDRGLFYRQPGKENIDLFRAGGPYFVLGDDGEIYIYVYGGHSYRRPCQGTVQ
jgi:hypothetical protein